MPNRSSRKSLKVLTSDLAYQVLSDEEQKKVYDRYGKEGLKQRQQQGGGGSPFGDIQYVWPQSATYLGHSSVEVDIS